MEASHSPKRPWYRKKRWWAFGFSWLLVPPLYLLASGPACYYLGYYQAWSRVGSRHRAAEFWTAVWGIAYRPAERLLENTPLERPWEDYAYGYGGRGEIDALTAAGALDDNPPAP